VGVRVGHAGAVQVGARVCRQPELLGVQRGMLAGQQEARGKAAGGERMGDRGKLDRFGPGADDQPDLIAVQPSP